LAELLWDTDDSTADQLPAHLPKIGGPGFVCDWLRLDQVIKQPATRRGASFWRLQQIIKHSHDGLPLRQE
jgi:hypothetical protein